MGKWSLKRTRVPVLSLPILLPASAASVILYSAELGAPGARADGVIPAAGRK